MVDMYITCRPRPQFKFSLPPPRNRKGNNESVSSDFIGHASVHIHM